VVEKEVVDFWADFSGVEKEVDFWVVFLEMEKKVVDFWVEF
jgi:hypothetical protein